MRRLALFFLLPCLLMCSASLFASTPPNPADYTVNVHVTASRTESICDDALHSCANVLTLDASIDGQKF